MEYLTTQNAQLAARLPPGVAQAIFASAHGQLPNSESLPTLATVLSSPSTSQAHALAGASEAPLLVAHALAGAPEAPLLAAQAEAPTLSLQGD